MPVRVMVSTVVVRSTTLSWRTTAFCPPIARARSAAIAALTPAPGRGAARAEASSATRTRTSSAPGHDGQQAAAMRPETLGGASAERGADQEPGQGGERGRQRDAA